MSLTSRRGFFGRQPTVKQKTTGNYGFRSVVKYFSLTLFFTGKSRQEIVLELRFDYTEKSYAQTCERARKIHYGRVLIRFFFSETKLSLAPSDAF